ncbi:MAG: Lrp/AsnC family transcriptional regulator [Hyphomicrobiales bacterium]|nr:Lrp/AsnC family transcriptional regulator [Hyphomicrobiales bacterium]
MHRIDDIVQIDQIDRKIIAALARDGRLTAVELSNRIGLSPSACTRRLQGLEAAGIITGYRALVDPTTVGLGVKVFVEVTLERQNDDALKAFEIALSECPNVLSCHLMSGSSDYLIELVARDLSDFEQVHANVLSRLPGVFRIESKFALRQAVDRPLAPIG